ncbi:ATP-binding response regulator [Niabella hibiscisoli]|uniref:ATP-binding response regulator n=1 Tax=Niabella hibiscisoli TaxID=1825928 RepID=UPI001F0DCF0E|nr:response regulator [Niabella hibiscisoli]MCH5718368.1 response regulator [Niabella hibiscisoli]
MHQNKLNFFTNISHEIRTQLTLITLPLEQLAEEEHHDLPKQSGYIGLIKHNAERLQLLVNELMDFRRVESGNLRLYPALHSLPQLLEEIVATFQDMAQMQNTTINIVYNGDDIPAYFDKNQLSKVFFNLINNALKYAPPDSRIDIEIEENNKEVITRVTDNGPGIPAEFLNNIFNNYYQVGEHEKQNTGYGIGLALSKSIVDLHKGHISVQSTRSELGNRGETIFEVSLLKGAAHLQALPHVVMNMEQTTEPDEPLPTAGFNTIDPTNQPGNADLLYTILVVEDNTELRKLVCNTFKAEYVVLEAVNGDEGLQIARQEIPDIIISDVMMPLMDGYAFCRQIKTDKRTSHIPVILLTAKNTQTDQISGLEQGANLYLTKPFSKRVLQLNVNNLLLLKEQQKQIVLSTLSELPAEQNVSAPSHAAGNQLAAIDQEFLDEIIKITEEQMDKDGFGVAVLSKK